MVACSGDGGGGVKSNNATGQELDAGVNDASGWVYDQDAGSWSWEGDGAASTDDGWIYVGEDAPTGGRTQSDGWIYVGHDGGAGTGSSSGSGGLTDGHSAQPDVGSGSGGGGADPTDVLSAQPEVGSGSGSSSGSGSGSGSSGGTPAPGTPGAFCTAHSDCKPGTFCIGAGGPNAYCTTTGCKGHDSCKAVQTSFTVCCLSAQQTTYCGIQHQAKGKCGDGGGKAGDDCVDGFNSDCNNKAGSYCFKQGPQAECVKSCGQQFGGAGSCPKGTYCYKANANPQAGVCLKYTEKVKDGSPCAGKNIGGCDKNQFCIAQGENDPYAYCATVCKGDADCDKGLFCYKYGAQGICQKYGTKKVGQSCAGDRWGCAQGLGCHGGNQASAVCAPQCVNDATCTSLGSDLFKSSYCAKGPNSPTGICIPTGKKKTGDDCSKDPYACEQGSFCVGGTDVYNPDAKCQKICKQGNTTDTCDAGTKCIAYNKWTSLCQVEGKSGQGQVCKGGNDCKAGFFCLGPGKAQVCMQMCEKGAKSGSKLACPASSWCNQNNANATGFCIPHGTAKVGDKCQDKPWTCPSGSFCQDWGQSKDAVCIKTCNPLKSGGPDQKCPAGNACKDFGQAGKYCMKSGGLKQGESCSKDATACAGDHFCMHKNSPHATCVKQCGKDADCKTGHWCSKGKFGGYCLAIGTLKKNESCYQKPYGCGKGLLCLGDALNNPGSFCGIGCSGFASACAKDEKCEYFGGGQSWCVKYGKLKHGVSCLGKALECEKTALCVKGTPTPTCLQTCGVGKPKCPDKSTCTHFPGSALKLCVPKGFTPFGNNYVPY